MHEGLAHSFVMGMRVGWSRGLTKHAESADRAHSRFRSGFEIAGHDLPERNSIVHDVRLLAMIATEGSHVPA
jgi:hypothetical protein